MFVRQRNDLFAPRTPSGAARVRASRKARRPVAAAPAPVPGQTLWHEYTRGLGWLLTPVDPAPLEEYERLEPQDEPYNAIWVASRAAAISMATTPDLSEDLTWLDRTPCRHDVAVHLGALTKLVALV